MKNVNPHYYLTCHTENHDRPGLWRFSLYQADGTKVVEEADVEPGVGGQRLALLALVRGLESLDQSAAVTLIGSPKHLREGILFGLPEWKENGWRWERFGKMMPVRDMDLWQRVDRAMKFHQVSIGELRIDRPENRLKGPHWRLGGKRAGWANGISRASWVKYIKVPSFAGFLKAVHRLSRFWQKIIGHGFQIEGTG